MEAFSFSLNHSPVVLGVPSAATPGGPGGPGGPQGPPPGGPLSPGGPCLPEGPGRPLYPQGPHTEGRPDEGLLLGRFWQACMEAWLH